MSAVRGWEVAREGMKPYVTNDAGWAAVYSADGGFAVTPLVAAPPLVGEAEAELAERLDDAWTGKGEYADGDVEVLRALCDEALMAVRHLASLACAAPSEGAPTYADLVKSLAATVAEMKAVHGEIDGDFDAVASAADALLSRIPRQEEGTDR